MSVKVSLFKSSADGEQLNVEYNLEKRDYDRMSAGESLRHIFGPYFRMCDDRLREMNLRIMTANTIVKKISPEAQVAFHNVMEVLHGQKPTDPDMQQLLREAVAEVVEKLVAQGVDRKQVVESLQESYGPDITQQYTPPQPTENPVKPTEISPEELKKLQDAANELGS